MSYYENVRLCKRHTVVRHAFCFWRFTLLFLDLATHYHESWLVSLTKKHQLGALSFSPALQAIRGSVVTQTNNSARCLSKDFMTVDTAVFKAHSVRGVSTSAGAIRLLLCTSSSPVLAESTLRCLALNKFSKLTPLKLQEVNLMKCHWWFDEDLKFNRNYMSEMNEYNTALHRYVFSADVQSCIMTAKVKVMCLRLFIV